MDLLLPSALILLGYLIGAIPVAYLAGRMIKGIDIRSYGSRNVGASNVYQSVAKWAVVPAGLAQIGLPMAAIGLAKALDQGTAVQVMAGLAALLGAAWSVYIGFSGGRAITSSIGFMLILSPPTLVVFTIVSLIGVALRNIPPAVGLGVLMSPAAALVFEGPGAIAAGCLGMAGIVFGKRLLADGRLPERPERREVLLNRLLFDRDIRSRDEWVRRGLADR